MSRCLKTMNVSISQSHSILVSPFASGSGLQPILVYMSKNSDGKFSYNPVSVNFLTEVCKVIFALGVLLISVGNALR